ncbi:LysE family transporter [Nonomuraea sp. NPDC003804]|uniref:LysE family translocator n=1 Tax=Nonomuraea sp. NPDC003804 TaxID=3154547 RepID=UPI0033A8767E
MSFAFLLTTLVVVATPGTGVVYTLSAGLSHGRGASVVAALGCTLGIVPHLLATITGLAALLHASPPAFQVLWLGGVFMLVTFVVFAAYGVCAASVRDQVTSRPRVMAWMGRVFAASFVALGVRLAFADL